MKKYIVYVFLSLLLITALELYRRLSAEPISTYLLIGYLNTIGLSLLYSNFSKVVILEERILVIENNILKGFIETHKELGKIEQRVLSLENKKTND